MFRNTAWRNAVSDAVSLHQDQALSTTILLLSSFGPTGFLLREEGGGPNFKVCLGDPHICTCPVFTKEREPCKHICWVLLRRFRLPREHEYSFQRGLVERQIAEVLRGSHQAEGRQRARDPSVASGTPSRPVTGQEAGSVRQKAAQAQDTCPICQEELLERNLPVCYCRFGCGNNVHIWCMKVWADHQRLSDRDDMVRCPLCREDFSSVKLLQQQVKATAALFTAAEREKPDRHLGVLCHGCRADPVTGRCFKCTVCSYVYLCEDCAERGRHPQHPLASRTSRRGKWRLVGEDLSGEPKGATSDDSHGPLAADRVPDGVLECLPTVRVRAGSRLLDDGQQCRICLQSFTLSQRVRTLPCQHKFHVDCVDRILRRSNSCPLDGYVVYDPLTWRASDRRTSLKSASCLSSDVARRPEPSLKALFVPGVALRDWRAKAPPAHGALSLEVLTGSSVPLTPPQTDRCQSFCVTATQADSQLSRSGDGQTNKTATRRSPASRGPPRLNLFVGLSREEPDRTPTATFPARRTWLQPRKRDTALIKHSNDRDTSALRMTGVMMHARHQRTTDT